MEPSFENEVFFFLSGKKCVELTKKRYIYFNFSSLFFYWCFDCRYHFALFTNLDLCCAFFIPISFFKKPTSMSSRIKIFPYQLDVKISRYSGRSTHCHMNGIFKFPWLVLNASHWKMIYIYWQSDSASKPLDKFPPFWDQRASRVISPCTLLFIPLPFTFKYVDMSHDPFNMHWFRNSHGIF